MCHLVEEKNVLNVQFMLPGGEPACWYTHLFLQMCFCVPVCYLEFEEVCACVWMGLYLAHKCAKSLTRLRWHVSLFVTMVTVSGLSRDVHPDDEIRLHQWRERAETNTGVSRGMSTERGCKRVGGMGPGNLLMECTKGIIKHTHIHTYTAVSLWCTCTHGETTKSDNLGSIHFFEPPSYARTQIHTLKHSMIPSAC